MAASAIGLTYLYPAGRHNGVGWRVEHSLVEDDSNRYHEVEDIEPLGADGVRQDLYRVAYNKRGERNVVRCVEEEDERDDSVRRWLRRSYGELGRAHGLHHEEDEHPGAGRDEQLAPPYTITKKRGAERPEEIPDLEDPVNEQLNGRIRDPDGIEDGVQVVGYEAITTPLYLNDQLAPQDVEQQRRT